MKTVFRFFAALLALNVLVSYAGQARADELVDTMSAEFVTDVMSVQGGSYRVSSSGTLEQVASAVITAWIERLQEKLSVDAYQGKAGAKDPYAPRYGVSLSEDEVKVRIALKF